MGVFSSTFSRMGHLENIWCTGEDSNLRSSQGAADLQSAAINHSATCAQPPSKQNAPAGNPDSDSGRREFRGRDTCHSLLPHPAGTRFSAIPLLRKTSGNSEPAPEVGITAKDRPGASNILLAG
jgi:hypothetical protein